MFLLAMAWMYLFLVELVEGQTPLQKDLITSIWILFILEFLIKLFLAPRRGTFVRQNWITVIALIIPALRIFRIFNALRLLRSVRVISSSRILRALTSGRRFFSAVKEAQGPQPTPEINVGILIAWGNKGNKESMIAFANHLRKDVQQKMSDSTGIPWYLHITEAIELKDEGSRRPSDFMDTASLRMAEGPYDLVLVLIDVGLISQRNHMVPGLSSPVSRMAVISTRKLIATGRNEELLPLDHPRARNNGAALVLHLMGHLLGLKDTRARGKKIMNMSEFNRELSCIPDFSAEEKKFLRKTATKAPDRELHEGNLLETFIFHLLMSLRHPKKLLQPLIENRAIFLPLSLPGLATAAVAPAIILVFTAETWDVGLGMTNGTAAFFAAISIMLASFYLVRVQSLFLPRKEKRILTEHLAVTNSVIYLSIFFACVGLFLLVGGLMMVIELYIFPPDLIQTWPTLDKPEILLEDKIRLAAFISTVGVTTGALAGGLESRTIIQHLALFRGSV